MKKTILLFTVIFFLSCKKENENTSPDNFLSIFNEQLLQARKSPDGGFIARSVQGSEANFIKMNVYGDKLWQKQIELEDSLHYQYCGFNSTDDGGLIIIVTCITDMIYQRDRALLVKVNDDGNLQWVKQIDSLWTSGTLILYDVFQTMDHGFAITGSKISNPIGNTIVKTDQGGITQWDTLLTTSTPSFRWITQLNDSGLVIADKTTFENGLGFYYSISKFSTTGNFNWEQTYLRNTSVSINALLPIEDGGLIICETHKWEPPDDTTKRVFQLFKTTSTGNSLWTKSFIGKGFDYYNSIFKCESGGFLMTGANSSYPTYQDLGINFHTRIMVIKLDDNYNSVWSRAMGGSFGSEGLIGVDAIHGYRIYGNQVSYGNPDVKNMIGVAISYNGEFDN